MAALAGGTTFSTGLIILAEPITSRMFPPEVFGIAATFYSIVLILGTIGCLRYEMALVLPREDEVAENLFVLCFIVLFTMMGLTALVVLRFGQAILDLLNMKGLTFALWLLPVAVFLTGFEFLLRRWHTRHKRFKRLALSRAMLAIPRVSAEIGGGAFGFTSSMNLISFRLFGLIGPTALLLWDFLKYDALSLWKHCTIHKVYRTARRYVKFPLYESLSSLLMSVSFHSPIILLTAFFGPDEAGLFAKAFYLLFLPTLLIGESTSQAFLQLSADRKARGQDLNGLVEIVLNRMISFGILPFAIITLIGSDIFGVALGSRWSGAGFYAQIISPWLFIVLLNNSITTLFGTLERQGVGLLFNLILVLLRLSILIAGGLILQNAYRTMLLFTWASVFVVSGKCLYLITVVGASPWRLVKHIVRNTLYAIPTLVITAVAKLWINLPSTHIVAIAIVSSLPYAIIVINKEPELKQLLMRLLEMIGITRWKIPFL